MPWSWPLFGSVVAVVAAMVGILEWLIRPLRRVFRIGYRWLIEREIRRRLAEERGTGPQEEQPRDPGQPVTSDLTYVDVEAAVSELARWVSHVEPDVLAGVDRGGAIVAGLVAKGQNRIPEALPIVVLRRLETPDLDYELTADVAGKRVVLLDDALRRGDTMTAARKRVQAKGAREIRMGVILRENRQRREHCKETADDAKAVYHTYRQGLKLPWDVEPSSQR